MKRETRNKMNDLKARLEEFFFVYYDEKTAKMIGRHPDRAIPLLKEDMLTGGFNKGRLTMYACALRNAVELETLRAGL